jgi:hypothetical protein
MNAIAFTREVLAVFGEPRRMMFSVVRAAILRGSQVLAPTGERSAFVPGMTAVVASQHLRRALSCALGDDG